MLTLYIWGWQTERGTYSTSEVEYVPLDSGGWWARAAEGVVGDADDSLHPEPGLGRPDHGAGCGKFKNRSVAVDCSS